MSQLSQAVPIQGAGVSALGVSQTPFAGPVPPLAPTLAQLNAGGTVPFGTIVVTLDGNLAISNGTQFVALAASVLSYPITPAEIAAGITPLNLAAQENHVLRYGVNVGTGNVLTDTTAINSTLAVAAQNGRPALFDGLTLSSSGGHIHDISRCGVDGLGAIINFTTMPGSATAWSLTSTVASIYSYNSRNVMTRLVLAGTGVGKGLVINTASGSNVLDGLQFSHGACINFATNCEIDNNSYILDFYGWCLDKGTTAALTVTSGTTNAAEKITFHGGFIGNSAIGINHLNGNTEIYLFGISLDDCSTASIYQANGSRIYGVNNHIEINNASTLTQSPIQVEGANCLLSLIGGYVIADGTQPFGFPSLFDIGANATVMTGGGFQPNNLGNTGNVLCTGAGRFISNDPFFQFANANNPTLIGATNNFNLLQDGGFELSSIADNVAITYDAGGSITTRTTSTTITSIAVSTAQHHSGAQSLAIVKGSSSGAAVGIFLPCTPGQRFMIVGYLYVSANLTGNIYINGNFATVVYGNVGIPILLGATGLGAQTITNPNTGSWIPFSIGGSSSYVVPHWCNTFYMQINIGTGAATYYLDDIVISAM